jgi:pumilio family protein 6
MADSAASAAAASSAGHKRKFDAPNGASNGAASSSHKKGGDWKKPRTGDRDAGKPWAKPAANATKIGPDGRPLPHPVGGNGKPWIKAADWKANTPVAYSRQERKDMKRERKASKPNADVIAEANKLWQVSLVNMTAAQRAAKIDELLAAIKGKVSEIGLKHDASRAIQIAVKHATEAQKHALLAEVKGQFKKLADDHYGHYIVIKMLSNDTRKGDVKKACLAEFKGHVGKVSGNIRAYSLSLHISTLFLPLLRVWQRTIHYIRELAMIRPFRTLGFCNSPFFSQGML